MEVSWQYGITNLIIVSLFYVGIAFAVTWMINKKTRIFGLVFAITLLLLTQLHANVLYYLTFKSLPHDYNIIGLILAFMLAAVLLVMQYQQLKASSIAIIDKQFRKNLGMGVLVTIGFTVALSLLGTIF